MRIWDLEPRILCRKHLLGEHRELHALWVIVTEHKKGYSKHPETLRWVGKLRALYNRHEQLVKEMERRDYTHRSPLSETRAMGSRSQTQFIHTVEEQKLLLKTKNCECMV